MASRGTRGPCVGEAQDFALVYVARAEPIEALFVTCQGPLAAEALFRTPNTSGRRGAEENSPSHSLPPCLGVTSFMKDALDLRTGPSRIERTHHGC